MAEKFQNVVPDTVKIIMPEKLSKIKIGEPKRTQSFQSKIQKIPPLPKLDKNNQQDYVPLVVSLGPYHHGKKELQMAEDFKITALEMFIADGENDMMFFYTKVFDMVKDARSCYIDDFTCQYDDPTFAQMMLLDACFIINFIASTKHYRNFYVTRYCLGKLVSAIILHDFFLMENQIPFWLLRMLICLRYGEKEGEEMLCDFLNPTFRSKVGLTFILRSEEELPLHLLDASWRTLVSCSSNDSEKITTHKGIKNNSKSCCCLVMNIKTELSKKLFKRRKYYEEECRVNKFVGSFHSFRCATELKAKGIHLSPSLGNFSKKSIKFTSGYFSATLEVPIWLVSNYTKEFFHNMIAYELYHCPPMDRIGTAHIEFMKLLIDSPKDVKELKEKKILLSTLDNDEEVVKVYKGINTHGMGNAPIMFQDVSKEIRGHYNNRAKTWLAELAHTYFRSPWTAIALLVTTALLVLTVLQTFFTIKPSKG